MSSEIFNVDDDGVYMPYLQTYMGELSGMFVDSAGLISAGHPLKGEQQDVSVYGRPTFAGLDLEGTLDIHYTPTLDGSHATIQVTNQKIATTSVAQVILNSCGDSLVQFNSLLDTKTWNIQSDSENGYSLLFTCGIDTVSGGVTTFTPRTLCALTWTDPSRSPNSCSSTA